MQPKVSIITTFYNSVSLGNFVHKAMDSLLNQSYKNIEFICVNDGSQDETLAQLEHYAENDPRIIIIDKLNEGTAQYAKAAGQDAATGELVMLFDHDDRLSADAVEKAVQVFAENPQFEMVGLIVKTAFPDDRVKNIYSLHRELQNVADYRPHTVSGDEALLNTIGRYDFHFRGLYRKEIFKKVSFRFTERLLNADEIVERLLLQHVNLIGSCDGVYTHFVHQDSSAKTFSLKKTDLVATDMYLREFAQRQDLYKSRQEIFEVVAYRNLIDAVKTYQHFRPQLSGGERRHHDQRLRKAFTLLPVKTVLKNYNGLVQFYHRILLSNYELFSVYYRFKK